MASRLKRDEVRVERDWFNGPDSRPLDGAAVLGGEAVACFLRLAVHLREDCGGEVALVEGALAAADDRGDDSGEGLDGAHGADGVLVLAGDGADFEREPGGGGEGVAAVGHGRGAGVRLLAVEGDGVALDAFGAEDGGEWEAEALEDGALLDVEFEVGGDVCAARRRRRRCGRCRCRCWRRAASSVMPSRSVRTRSAAMECVPANAEEPKSERPKRAPSSSAQSTRRTVKGGWPLKSCGQGGEDFERGDDAEGAIEPAAVGDRVEMRAEDERAGRRSGERDPGIARCVECGA